MDLSKPHIEFLFDTEVGKQHLVRYVPGADVLEKQSIEDHMLELMEEMWSAKPDIYGLVTNNGKNVVQLDMSSVFLISGKVKESIHYD